MVTLANSDDPDEMQHNAAFHQGLHYLLTLKQPSETEIYHNLEKTKLTQWAVPSLLYQYIFMWKLDIHHTQIMEIWIMMIYNFMKFSLNCQLR